MIDWLRKWRFLPHAVYFVLNVASGALDQFLTVALQRAGLPPSKLSLLICARPVGALLAQPLVAAFADCGRSHAIVVRRCVIFASICSVLIPVLHSVCFEAGFDVHLTAILVGLLMLAMSIARAPVGPMIDMFTLHRLGNAKNNIGSIKMWGTIGYCLVGIAIGGLVRHCEYPLFVFIVFALVQLVLALPLTLALASNFVEATDSESSKNVKEEKSKNVISTIIKVLTTGRMAAFLISVFGAGYCHCVFAQYATLYMASRSDTSSRVLSVSAFVKLLGEVPIFAFGRHLLQLFDAHGLVWISLVASVIRLCGFLTLKGDWVVLPQMLHGCTFGAFWLAMMVYASQLAPNDAEATAQAVVSATYGGAASVISSLLNGAILDAYGFDWIFDISIIIATASLIVFTVFVGANTSTSPKKND